MTLIAELDLADTSDKVRVRLFAPVAGPEPEPWTCRFEIGGYLTIPASNLMLDAAPYPF